MSSEGLNDLIEACRAAPAREGILRAMIREARETADPSAAVDYLTDVDPPDGADQATRFLAGDFLMEQDAHQAALEWYRGETPESSVRLARAYLALGNRAEAASVYLGAVRTDETLRDADLDRELAVARSSSGADIIDFQERRGVEPAEEAPVVMPKAEVQRITFADVGGLEQVKRQITRKIILPFQKPGLFQKFRRKAGGGILLYGLPVAARPCLPVQPPENATPRFMLSGFPIFLICISANRKSAWHRFSPMLGLTGPRSCFLMRSRQSPRDAGLTPTAHSLRW